MDYLLDIIATEPTYTKFTADCQVAMIADYLEVKPSAKAAISAALAAGQLLAGPYYVPPNEFLINGEGYVRNLLLARHVLQELGLPGPNCTAGYSPDSACSDFGHPAQVPQIWRLLGLPYFVAHGLGGRPSDFQWEAPDGSRLHMITLVSGYSSVADLSENIDKGAATLLKTAKELAPRYMTPNVLLFNGNDHLLPQRHLGNLIARANETQEEFVFSQASYEEYASSVEDALQRAGTEMTVYRGEFMEHGSHEADGKMRKVNGFFSSRVYLKQANFRCEQVLSGHAEPLSTLEWIIGKQEYPDTHLREAWTWVVRNHHHDSIPGTSTDTVHKECMTRYIWAEQMGTGIAVKKLNELAQHIPGIPPGLVEDNDSEGAFLVVFNPHPWAYRGPITFDLMDNWEYCAEPSTRLVPMSYAMTQVAPPAFYITDASGQKFPVIKDPIPDDSGYKFNQGVTNCLLSFVNELPAFGYKVFELHPTERPVIPAVSELQIDPDTSTIENEFLKIVVVPDGTITMTDKASGHVYPNLLEIVDYGDRGDQYDQAPVKDPEVEGGWSRVSSLDATPEITWIEVSSPRGRVDIHHVLSLPTRFVDADRTDHAIYQVFPVTVSVRLYEHAKRVEVTVTMNNHSENHRVELRVPTGISTEQLQVDGAFCTSSRAVHYYQTAAMHRFIDINDGSSGFAVFSKGIYEYNPARAPDGSVIVDLTLLRCVSVLAGHHIGNRWPANSTPESQCKGTTICELAIACHDGDAIESSMHRLAGEFCMPPRAIEPLEHLYLRGKCEKTLPGGEHSFVTLEPQQLAMTAFYKDDAHDVAYLRFYNAAPSPCEAHLVVDFKTPVTKVELVDLKGGALPDQQSLIVDGTNISIQVGPAQILTLALSN